MPRLLFVMVLVSCGDDAVRQSPDAPPPPTDTAPDESLPLPTLVSSPADVTVIAGSPATFQVTAEGTSLTYQWSRGGAAVVGANAATYTLASTTTSDDGATFQVRVCTGPQSANACVDSASATLGVLPANTLTATQIVAGYETNVVVRPDGTVWAWGGLHRLDGTYHTATTTDQIAKHPVQIYPSELVGVTRVAAWYDGFWALRGTPGTVASRVLHWGRARDGSDGRGTDGAGGVTGTVPQFRDNFVAPVEVLERTGGTPAPVDRVCSIAGGASSLLMIRAVDTNGVTTSCAPGASKTAWMVGTLTAFESESTGIAFPIPGLPTDSPPALVVTGATFSGTPPWLVALEDGRVFAFGVNPYNGLGLATPAPSRVGSPAGPTLLPAAWGNGRALSASFYYSAFVVDETGAVRTSGRNQAGELGLGDLPSGTLVNGPSRVLAESCASLPCSDTLSGVTAIASNSDLTTLALKGGRLFGWGNGVSGLLGPAVPSGQTQPFPRAIPTPLVDLVALSSSTSHALVIGRAGAVYAWGSGLRGALGDDAETPRREAPGLVLVP